MDHTLDFHPKERGSRMSHMETKADVFLDLDLVDLLLSFVTHIIIISTLLG